MNDIVHGAGGAPEATPLQATTIPRRWLRVPEAAEYVGLSINMLENFRRNGRGPTYRKLGKAVIYDIADLDAFLEGLPRLGGGRA